MARSARSPADDLHVRQRHVGAGGDNHRGVEAADGDAADAEIMPWPPSMVIDFEMTRFLPRLTEPCNSLAKTMVSPFDASAIA